MGGVFSQSEGFTELNLLWGGLVFHAVTTGAGVWLVGGAAGARRTAGAGVGAAKDTGVGTSVDA